MCHKIDNDAGLPDSSRLTTHKRLTFTWKKSGFRYDWKRQFDKRHWLWTCMDSHKTQIFRINSVAKNTWVQKNVEMDTQSPVSDLSPSVDNF